MKFSYKTTTVCCFLGYIVQAIVNNFAPLLFVTFQNAYSVSLDKITALVVINFATQILTDLAASKAVRRIGYRTSVFVGHLASAVGLLMLGVLPLVMDAFSGLVIAVVIYAVGGGIIEVLISPIIDNCPSDNKEKAMSLLHSFYCWGHALVVVVSTTFFAVFGTEKYVFLSVIWSFIPLVNAFLFLKAPINEPENEKKHLDGIKSLFGNKLFWILMLMMFLSGASELAISQWASSFAEKGLLLSKTLGDLVGPLSFAIMMGLSRTFYGKLGEKIKLNNFMLGSCVFLIAGYIVAGTVNVPILNMLGCAVCGLSVGIMWPGTVSLSSTAFNGGITAMYALLALSGDVGCMVGPAIVGLVSDLFGTNLKIGILSAVIFPLLLLISLVLKNKIKKPSHS